MPKFRRTKNREYRYENRRKVRVSEAEYGLFIGDEKVLVFPRSGKIWRVCEPSENSKIGVAVSPYHLRKLRDLKEWAIENYEGK
jgi:hypothetical protein